MMDQSTVAGALNTESLDKAAALADHLKALTHRAGVPGHLYVHIATVAARLVNTRWMASYRGS